MPAAICEPVLSGVIMATTARVDEDDVGKLVVDTVGRELGIVVEIEQGTAYIDPEPGIVSKLRTRLGFGDADGKTLPLHENRITAVTDEAIRVTDVP
jgi:hypothetical protein